MASMGSRVVGLGLCFGAFTVACGEGGNGAPDEEVGAATLELSTVPTGAQCLQLIGTGTAAFNVTATLTPGASSQSVTVGRLPLGASTVTANVFDVACSSIGGATATWLADTQTVTFRAGVVTKLTLTLRPNNPVSVNANFIGNIVSVAGGHTSSGLVLSDGSTRLTGDWSPLGSSTTFSLNPASLTGILELAPPKYNNAHACARNASQVLCWGPNPNGQLGPGIAVGTSSATPVVVTGLPNNIQQIAAGRYHNCALQSGGRVYCWGLNATNQLGNMSTVSTSTPQLNTFLFGVDMIAAGIDFTCANDANGLKCWGKNSSGECGVGDTTTVPAPLSNGAVGVVSVAAGSVHACAVRADGTAHCWGGNLNGQLGDGTTTQRLTPTQVSGITDAVEVAAGAAHTCFRRSGGGVTCTGNNDSGQLGDGTATSRTTLLAVPGVTGAIAISAGSSHTCALLDNRSVVCWGSDSIGQAGDGAVGNNYKPKAATIQ